MLRKIILIYIIMFCMSHDIVSAGGVCCTQSKDRAVRKTKKKKKKDVLARLSAIPLSSIDPPSIPPQMSTKNRKITAMTDGMSDVHFLAEHPLESFHHGGACHETGFAFYPQKQNFFRLEETGIFFLTMKSFFMPPPEIKENMEKFTVSWQTQEKNDPIPSDVCFLFELFLKKISSIICFLWENREKLRDQFLMDNHVEGIMKSVLHLYSIKMFSKTFFRELRKIASCEGLHPFEDESRNPFWTFCSYFFHEENWDTCEDQVSLFNEFFPLIQEITLEGKNLFQYFSAVREEKNHPSEILQKYIHEITLRCEEEFTTWYKNSPQWLGNALMGSFRKKAENSIDAMIAQEIDHSEENFFCHGGSHRKLPSEADVETIIKNGENMLHVLQALFVFMKEKAKVSATSSWVEKMSSLMEYKTYLRTISTELMNGGMTVSYENMEKLVMKVDAVIKNPLKGHEIIEKNVTVKRKDTEECA